MKSEFPCVRELPEWTTTKSWTWAPFVSRNHGAEGAWIGTDSSGQRWLCKFRGSSYAFREIVFAKMAQEIGWSCQSSIYVVLDEDSAKATGRSEGEVHSAHWFMAEHPDNRCGVDCVAAESMAGCVKDLKDSAISNIVDMAKGDISAYIFGANEHSGRFITTQHRFVIIDSEQMFSSGPCEVMQSPWVRRAGMVDADGFELALEVCLEVASLSDQFLNRTLLKPTGVQVVTRIPIEENVRKSVNYARRWASTPAARSFLGRKL